MGIGLIVGFNAMKYFLFFTSLLASFLMPAWADFTLATSQKLQASVVIADKGEQWCDTTLTVKFSQLTSADALSVDNYDALSPKVQALITEQCPTAKDVQFINGQQRVAYAIESGNWQEVSDATHARVLDREPAQSDLPTTQPSLTTFEFKKDAPIVEAPKVTAKENSVEPSSDKQDEFSSFPRWIVSLLIALGLLAGLYFLLKQKGRSLLQQRGFVLGLMALSFIPAYVLPYYGSNSSIANAAYYLMRQDLLVTFWVHLFCYGIAILLMWQAQQGVKKAWVAAPLLAAVFDLTPGLSSLPLIPTLLMAVSLFGIYFSGVKSELVFKELSVDRVINNQIPKINESLPITDGEVMENNKVSTKPVGVLVISILNGLGGAILAIVGMIGFLAGVGVNDMGVLFIGLITSIFGTLFLALTYGLWMLTDWGHRYTKMAYIVSIPITLISLITDFSATSLVSSIISIAICVWVIVYLVKPNIRQLFSH